MLVAFQILTPILVVIIGGVGWLYRHEKERRREVEKQLSQKKYDAYIKLMDLYFVLFKSVKTNKPVDYNKVGLQLIDIKKELIIYASDDVYKSFNDFLLSLTKGSKNIRIFAELAISIRRDMGQPNTNVTAEDILISIMQDQEEFEKLKQQGFFE